MINVTSNIKIKKKNNIIPFGTRYKFPNYYFLHTNTAKTH